MEEIGNERKVLRRSLRQMYTSKMKPTNKVEKFVAL
jgi:hypothetical protein